MHANKKISLILIQSMLTLPLSSCSVSEVPVATVTLSDPELGYQGESVARRFEEPLPEDSGTVEPTVKLSQKYAKLCAEMTSLRLKSQDLIAENRQLREEAASLDTQLKQAQRELTEANKLLMEMVVELNNWKSDVIGFREEIRCAEKTQLEALLKILEVLGGEVKVELAQGNSRSSNVAAVIEAVEHQPQKGFTTGDPNE